MKFSILGDTHIGARNSSLVFSKYFEKYFTEVYIPHLKAEGITTVFQLGDLFDTRKFTNHVTLAHAKKYLFDTLQAEGITFHTLVGNHDIAYRESLAVDTSTIMLREYDNVVIHKKPTTVEIDGTSIDIIPWICNENREEITDFIRKSKSDLCFGHFEIAGFAMYRGMEAHEGLSTSMFEKYELVCSGHYHTRSQKENITYVGTPYELTWQDCADPRGHHVFDTETRKLTFHQNPLTMFERIVYDDKLEPLNMPTDYLAGKYVKIVVVDKKDPVSFDTFCRRVYNRECVDIKIVEDAKSEYQEGEIREDINIEDTLSIMNSYIDSVEDDENKERVKEFMRTLYVEALNSDTL